MLYPIQNEIRSKVDLSGIWDFQTDPEEVGEQEGWFGVLTSQAAGRGSTRSCGSACYFGVVYVNGVKVGSHEGGHLPFAFDISQWVKWDEENTFAISVENHLKPDRVPSGGVGELGLSGYPAATFDFFPFAGIHRPVVLFTSIGHRRSGYPPGGEIESRLPPVIDHRRQSQPDLPHDLCPHARP